MAASAIEPLSGLLGWCRAGFEPELAAEFTERAAAAGLAGYAQTQRDSGVVLFHGEEGAALQRALPWRALVFARQSLRLIARLHPLDASDRISPILQALDAAASGSFADVWVEHPDSDAGKPLAALARSFGNALRPALKKHGLLDPSAVRRLHVAFLAGDHAVLADADPQDAAPWPLGIPRLKLHRDAPSRSALKLEEALLVLLDADERDTLLRPVMRAADLGAAPGGWTWVLTRHGLHVTAIDNGPLREHVLATGQVTHLREDGFRWQPPQPLDWMVCDMVEQPIRVAARMAQWFAQGWCRHAVFNLKLPMKKRWLETQRCLDAFAQAAPTVRTLRARQLYHDREEVTVFASTQA